MQRGRDETQGGHLSSCCSSGAREINGRKKRGQDRCAEIFLEECPLKTAHSIAGCLFTAAYFIDQWGFGAIFWPYALLHTTHQSKVFHQLGHTSAKLHKESALGTWA